MEWDAFWSINKKGYEASAPRYMAVFKDSAVPLEISNGPAEPAGITIPLHPKRPELGSRVLRLARRVFLEGPDAATIKEGEEVTLTRWGNVKVQAIERDAGGKVVALKGEYNAEGDPRATEKKLTWLADVEDVVPVVLTEFDYLISKKKLEEGVRAGCVWVWGCRNVRRDPHAATCARVQCMSMYRAGFPSQPQNQTRAPTQTPPTGGL